MAILREPEYCNICGEQLEEMHRDQSHIPIMMQNIGDNFIGYKPHTCKPSPSAPLPTQVYVPIDVSERNPTKEGYYHTRGMSMTTYWHNDLKKWDEADVYAWLELQTLPVNTITNDKK